MPSESSSSMATGSRKSSTRSSIRQSLNFASVGKAFADVMNKETREKDIRDSEKSGKKAMKDSHRSSVGFRGLAPRPSLDRPSPPPTKRPRTPDSKTITARRRSSVAHHQQPTTVESGVGVAKSPDPATPQTQGAAVHRSSSLRPRLGTSSGLPKYRPKSIVVDKKPDSPETTTTRKRPSISDDDKNESTKEQMKPDGAKTSRPISPLPHRAAFKVALTNIPPSPSPKPQSKPSTPTPSTRSSPTRLVRHKKVPSAEQRPPSSTSSSSTPRTPKASPARSSGLRAGSSRKNSATTESSDDSSHPSHPGIHDSPLVRHVRQRSRTQTPTKEKEANVANMSHISEVDSEDGEEHDVEMLLAPVAAIGAPTPAMPRIQISHTRHRLVPQTPTKPNLSPAREILMPPDAESSPARLRTTPASDRSAPRGSILSWEQFATEASRTLDEEEISTILSDIPAPFQPGPLSPVPTGETSMLLPVPESPCLSTMSSPSGYGGSISQVLLPTVTPSPAIPRSRFKDSPSDRSTKPEATALVPLLRLQLSAAENTAKERLVQMQLLEEAVHNLKQARSRDAQELTQQFSLLEEQMKGKLEVEEKSAAHVHSLEEQLRKADVARRNAIEEAVDHTQKRLRSEWKSALKAQQMKWDTAFVAQSARREWDYVREQCEDDLEALQRDKELISFLLGEMDFAQRNLIQARV